MPPRTKFQWTATSASKSRNASLNYRSTGHQNCACFATTSSAKHKGKDEGVCEINHETYYRRLDHRELHAPVEIFPTVEKLRERFGDVETAERVVGVAFYILFVALADDADLRQRRELLDSESD